MDNRLKQRLVGATVVVALAVIIVPEIIRGPARQEPAAVQTAIPPAPDEAPDDRGMTVTLEEPPPAASIPPID
ncbi:MAG: sporulation protein, partial [Pseudomonadota bacterium]|nr:sporulation protein [Pseudomonadota bacterium]